MENVTKESRSYLRTECEERKHVYFDQSIVKWTMKHCGCDDGTKKMMMRVSEI